MKNSLPKLAFATLIALFLIPAQSSDLAGETACQENFVCSSTNTWGAYFTGTISNIEYYDNGCIKQYNCHYDDGMRRRYTY